MDSHFTRKAFLELLGAATLTAVIGCGSDSDDGGGSSNEGGSSGEGGTSSQGGSSSGASSSGGSSGSASGGNGGSSGSSSTGGSGATTSTGGSSVGGTTSTGGSSAGGSGGAGTGGATGGTGSGDCVEDIDAQITCRHDHRMIVPAADIAAGQEKSYDIRGTNATHGHDVVVTAAMFEQLKQGQTVEIFVPSSFQPHTVYLSCAGLDPSARDDEACN